MSGGTKEGPAVAVEGANGEAQSGGGNIITDPAAAVVVADTRLDPELNLLRGDPVLGQRFLGGIPGALLPLEPVLM